MNTLFNSALRQSNAIRKDLDAFQDSGSSSPALLGQINASLASFNRTLDDYNKLAKQEIIPAKQEKAFERLKNFRSEQNDYRDRLTSIRQENEEQNSVAARNELLGRRPHAAATPENPYAHSNLPQNSAFRPGGGNAPTGSAYVQADYTRETHVLRESGFMAQTNAQLDEYLERGRAVLGDLGQQRDMLKNTQRKLYSVANTLGISGDTIRMVERRAKQDKWIFWAGVVVFFLFCWLVLHYLR